MIFSISHNMQSGSSLQIFLHCLFLIVVCKCEDDKRELRKKAEEYLKRAEDLKQQIKQGEGVM